MKSAEKFGRPIITFIDTPGAYPGIDAEERGQAEAIARNLLEMSRLKVPIIGSIIGEGGSGGALAIAICDSVIMLENAIYSVISPEGCAAILWKDATKSTIAAKELKLTAQDLFELGIVDQIVQEPQEDAHLDPDKFAESLDKVLFQQLTKMQSIPQKQLQVRRFRKLRELGFV
jgi:acetyl-CoA carboxylase carboxyl transferase subunit alpha